MRQRVAKARPPRPPLPAGEPPAPGRLRAVALLVGALACVALAYRGLAGHGFLNWDDPDVLVRNPSLDGPDVAAWAFRTTHIGHYQPLAWLVWSALRRAFGTGALVHHLAALGGHLLNTALVFLLAGRLFAAARIEGLGRSVAAAAAALAFGLHPLRVEPVAWASAFPYVLGLAPLLLAVLAYLRFATRGGRGLLAGALGLYVVSLACRPLAPGFALVLLCLDAWLGRTAGAWRRVLHEKVPFAAAGLLAAVAEASARRFAPLERVGLVERLGNAAWAPFRYLGRTLWPAGLTPLDALPLEAREAPAAAAAGLVMLATATLLAWRLRARSATPLAGWLAFLVLAAPAVGLAPSGLAATADRYTYVPGVVIALLVGAAFAGAWAAPGRRPVFLGIGLALVVAMGMATARYLGHWRDSISLWTRALQVEPRNDVALYNLALALDEAGDHDGALIRYDELLRLMPEHGPARHNRDLLLARRLEQDAGGLAARGRLAEAVAAYDRALELDPRRLHSRRSRGMALAELGRCEAAVADLREAVAAQPEPAVVHAFVYCLRRSGRSDEAERWLPGEAPAP